MKNKLLLIFFLLTNFVFSQDTICVTRTEMLHYANNAIELKTIRQNYILLESDLFQCKSVLNQSIEINEQKNVLIANQQKFNNSLLAQNGKISKSNQRLKISITALSASLITSIIFNLFQNE